MDIYAYEPLGIEGCLVRIEVDIRRGIPAVDVVGLAAAAVRESRERVRAAIRNSGFEFPQDRVLINLSPADLPKEGASYDLPIAVKILSTAGAVPDCGNRLLIMGELTLDGCVCPVKGTLPALLQAARSGIRHFVIPAGNYPESRRLRQGHTYPVKHISEIPDLLMLIREGRDFPQEGSALSSAGGSKPAEADVSVDANVYGPDFSDYLGNETLMRALVVAAAGRHNVLLFGPPGSGKTAAAMRFPSLLPCLSEQHALEVAAIWSLCGKQFSESWEHAKPPVRSPHHSASVEGIIGGGKPAKPGEISLAHRGVLFLDETPEFRHDVLQSLREPLERGYISVVRAGRIMQYPADFQLILAANPCPCGNLGNPAKVCICSPQEIQRYWKKLGGPLLDRIDMRIPVHTPDAASLLSTRRQNQPELLRQVETAVKIQAQRTEKWGGIFNSRMQPAMVARFCVLDANAQRCFKEKADEIGLSARACHSVLKIARTIADLEGAGSISETILSEAMGYRQYGEGDNFWPF